MNRIPMLLLNFLFPPSGRNCAQPNRTANQLPSHTMKKKIFHFYFVFLLIREPHETESNRLLTPATRRETYILLATTKDIDFLM